MIVLVNRMFIPKRFGGLVIWPFVLIKDQRLRNDLVFMNHERIHLRQQMELLVIPFFIWYGIEFIVRWIQFKDRHIAYRNISFEKEAYENEKDLNYLEKRSLWGFFYY